MMNSIQIVVPFSTVVDTLDRYYFIASHRLREKDGKKKAFRGFTEPSRLIQESRFSYLQEFCNL